MVQAYLCFETDMWHFVASTLVTYLIMAIFPKRCGWIAFAYNMAHLTWGYVLLWSLTAFHGATFEPRISLLHLSFALSARFVKLLCSRIYIFAAL